MKSCVSTYSYQRLYGDGKFTRFDAIDKTKELGCEGVEFVLDDTTPDGSTRSGKWSGCADILTSLRNAAFPCCAMT